MNYDLEELKQYLPQYIDAVTERRKPNVYNCPLCKSGTGANKTAAFTLYPEDMHWYCHACKQSGSIIDLYIDLHQMSRNSREDISTAIKELGAMFHLTPTTSYKAVQRNPAPLPPVKPGKREHIYRNKDGNILAKKSIEKRNDGSKKTCWYLYDNATGTYSYGLNHNKMPLYHADKLHNSQGIIYFVEGEKDVETLENCYGFTATCTPNGGGQTVWLESYNASLAGRDCIIITDNDSAGKKYGETVAKNISGTAKSIKIVPSVSIWENCPEKGDISDIIEILGKGKTAQLLSETIKRTKPYVASSSVTQNQRRKKTTSVYDVDGTGYLTIDNLTEYLNRNHYTVTYDEILHDYTYSGFKGESQEHLKETVPDIICDKLQFELKGCSPSKIARLLTVIATRNKVNPIRTMIENTVWDGKDRLEEVYTMFGIDKTDTLSRTLFRKWSMQAIAGLYNTYESPFSLDIVLVFQGAQGIAKTRFFEHLAMIHTYFGEGYTIDTRNKDDVIQVTCNWIVELGEIGSTMRKDMDSLKAFLTKSMDEYRSPYDRAALKYPRHTNFVGTVNDERYLIDETGNRRFATIQIKQGISLNYETQIVSFDSLQFWAQIYSIVFAEVESGATIGGCFRLTDNEKMELEKRNSGFIKSLKGEDEVLDILARFQEMENQNPKSIEYRLVTTTEFRNAHLELIRYSTVQIGRVLTKLGIPEVMKKVCGHMIRLRKLPFTKNQIN
ncbi:MAG: hypothetical protein IKI37_08315 [Oscillospiraceae bacterium]|nr:hypothetical protein [Oscillospiraceae bacterium]